MQEDGFPSFQENYGSPMTRRIEDWKSRLIDLSKRNNLLYFKPSKRGNLSVSSPNMESIFNRLVLRKRSFEFWYPPPEETAVPTRQSQNNINYSFPNGKTSPTSKQLLCGEINRADLEKVVKNLQRRSLLDYRERGVRILHATFGMLVWKEKDTGEEVRSPLVLVPIELARKSFREPFAISVPPIEEEAVLNPALQVKLKKDFKIDLPPLPEYWESQSLLNYLSVVTQVADKLGWRVESTVEIGLFSFYKLVIYKDLDTNAGVIKQHPIIRKIAGIKDEQLETVSLPDEKDVDDIQSPEKTFQVLDADSSQRVSIEYALRGQSFVMQGPPGTGKSQTIANIIAECIAHGKSVLFVSDKMAALEVVYKRLREVGLSSFCLELHSSKANKREVVAELKKSLDEHLVPRKLPPAHDFEKMTMLRDNLNKYVVSLHQKRLNLQKSAYDVLGELSTLESVPFVAVELPSVGSLTPQQMHELENLMSHLKSVWQAAEDPDFPWRGYRGDEYDLEVRAEVSTVLTELISTIEALKLEAANFANQLGLDTPPTLERVKWLIEIGNLLLESPKPEATWVMHPTLDRLIGEAEAHLAMFEWCKATRSRLLERYNEAFFSLALTRSAELEAALAEIDKLLLNSGVEESELLEKREKLLGFVKHTQVLYAKWSEKSWQLAQALGLPTGNLTPDRVKQLSRLALLCFSEDKPDPRWLDPSNFQRLKEEFPQIKKDYQEHQALKLKLEKTYTREFFKTDLDEFIRRYNDLYKSSLRWFRPSFYSDQKQIALLTHDGNVPKSVLQDLLDARKLKMLSAEIDASAESVKELLGHFYEGYATDFERAEKAVEVTSELFKQAGAAGIPEKLATLVSYGSDPPLVIRQLGNELEELFEKWDQLAKGLSSLLPTSRLPTSNLPLYETPITLLQEWARSVEKPLAVLCEVTKETLKTNKSEPPQNYKQLIDDLKDAEQVRKKEAEFLAEQEVLQKKFGFRFAGLETGWEEIISVLNWTKRLRTLFGSQRVPEAFADVVSRGAEYAPSNSDLISRYDVTVKSLAALEARFETEPTYQGKRLQALSLDAMERRVKWLREHVDDLQVWVDFKETKHAFSMRGLSAFFDRLAENPPSASQLPDIFRKAAYQEWLNHLYEEDPVLGQFRREKHEHTIAEFVKLDQELIRLSPNRVIEAANSRKPQDIIIQAEDSEVTTLTKEALKKRQLMPIRNLLQRIPHLLSRLKPCLLMSPMSVSQFLPPDLMKFDLILFDEASQIVPEDAIGTIYRGKTIVVAGDNKQLPPTSFFQKSLLEDIDWDEVTDEDVEVFDSILDESAGVGLPVKTLRWHYRSKHEELIVFSNSHFYDGTLITFPSALAKADGLGVKLVHVPDGIYDRGGKRDNLKEAEVVADLVFEHFQKYPKKTLGVVTFSIAQMDAVDDAVERRRREHPEYEHFFKEDRLEGFFVKNLENVQGDERDAIILSLGYGYDPQGQMTMNFGPVNRAGGERRLNVAITRAREMTILVASVKATDLDMESARSIGTVILHSYLEYAEHGPEILKSSAEPVAFESPIEEDVAMVLQRLGYAFTPRVGYSGCPIDMGVVDPHDSGSYLLGIEFDGATYQSSSSARDRDRLRAQVLKQLGWRIHRVWSPSWVSRRDSEIRRLSHALEEAHQFKLGKETPSTDVELEEDEAAEDLPQEGDVQKIQFAGIEKIGVPYKVHPLKAEYAASVRVPSSNGWTVQPNEFQFPENRQLQSQLLEELIQNEGPIHFDYAVKRLVSAWGLKRKNSNIVHAVREALNLLILKDKVVVKGNFLWPPELQDVTARVPVVGVPESKRKPAHIPPEEIENAMKTVAQYALGISAESLIAETAKVFGFSRPGDKSRKRFSDIYKRLLWEKKLVCDNDLVTVAD
jgi:superfamily I DNA and/or RNA helicase